MVVGIIQSSLRRFLFIFPISSRHGEICNSERRGREFESRPEQGKTVFKIQEEYILSQKAILEMIFKGIEIESFIQLRLEDLNIKPKSLLTPLVITIEQELHIHWKFLKLLEH